MGCLIWEGSFSRLQVKGGAGCRIWEGSLSCLQEKGRGGLPYLGGELFPPFFGSVCSSMEII